MGAEDNPDYSGFILSAVRKEIAVSENEPVTRRELALREENMVLKITSEVGTMLDDKFTEMNTRLDDANITHRNNAFFEATGFDWENREKSRSTMQYSHKKMNDEQDTRKKVKMVVLGVTVPAGLAWVFDKLN